MDAGSTDADNAARATQWEQLRDAILARNSGHPVIVMGDTNSRYTRDDIAGLFVAPLSDAYDVAMCGWRSVSTAWLRHSAVRRSWSMNWAMRRGDSGQGYLSQPQRRLRAPLRSDEHRCRLQSERPQAPLRHLPGATGPRPTPPAEANAWVARRGWTGDGQKVSLYNVGQKYFLSNESAPGVTSIAQAPEWTIRAATGTPSPTTLTLSRMKGFKSMQGVVRALAPQRSTIMRQASPKAATA